MADTSFGIMLLQKLQINHTVVSNPGCAKNDFNDFKIDFPVQKFDFNQKKHLEERSQLRVFSNILE